MSEGTPVRISKRISGGTSEEIFGRFPVRIPGGVSEGIHGIFTNGILEEIIGRIIFGRNG